jgi:anaerobic selenocysteine-containing dehydrogenase
VEDTSPSSHPDLSRRNVLKAGIATTGAAALGVAASSVVATPAGAENAAASPDAGYQSNWRFCSKCYGLFYYGFADNGVCPAGGAHLNNGSLDYNLYYA